MVVFELTNELHYEIKISIYLKYNSKLHKQYQEFWIIFKVSFIVHPINSFIVREIINYVFTSKNNDTIYNCHINVHKTV